MTQPMRRNQSAAEFDKLVDQLLEDPGLADDVKPLVRKHLTKSSVVNLSKSPRAVVARQEDDDDMWDNVPV